MTRIPLFSTPILMNAVDSGNIYRIGYDPEIRVLEVEFKGNGQRYRYRDVPEDVYVALYESPSKGSFLAKHIKGRFECLKFEPVPQPEIPPETHISEK